MQLLEQLGTDNVVHDKRKVLLCLKYSDCDRSA